MASLGFNDSSNETNADGLKPHRIPMNKLEQQILDFISHPDYKPVKRNKLSSRLNLADKLVARHKAALQSLNRRRQGL